MDKKKIVYMISSLKKGGPVNQLYSLIKYMNKYEYDIYLIILNEIKTELNKNFENINCKIIKSEGENILLRILYSIKMINELKPDIIHTHGGISDFISANFMKKFNKVSTIHCVPNEDYIYKYGLLKGKIKSEIIYNNLNKIDEAIACSKTVSEKIFNYKNKKYKYIRNGIDTEFFITKDNVELDKDIKLIFCGYLSNRKNAKFLVEVINMLERKDFELSILGDGEQFSQIKEISKNNKKIKLIGKVDNVKEYLNKSDIIISASKSEGLPLSILEGMAMNLGCILSDIDSHKEIYELSKESILLFEEGNHDSLINILNSITKDKVYDMRIKSRSVIDNELNSKTMADKYNNAYKKLIEGANR